uniref:Uncharacterized protein n=1 Tax=Lygus hesperus TaxID=30085 RepID=A0A0A9XET6_LYGHE
MPADGSICTCPSSEVNGTDPSQPQMSAQPRLRGTVSNSSVWAQTALDPVWQLRCAGDTCMSVRMHVRTIQRVTTHTTTIVNEYVLTHTAHVRRKRCSTMLWSW